MLILFAILDVSPSTTLHSEIAKVSLPIVTGLFGILALLTEFREKGTARITKWGYVSLFGIILSSTLSTVVQVKDFASEQAQSEETLKEIARGAVQIDSISANLDMELLCSDGNPVKDFCHSALPKSVGNPEPYARWPQFITQAPQINVLIYSSDNPHNDAFDLDSAEPDLAFWLRPGPGQLSLRRPLILLMENKSDLIWEMSSSQATNLRMSSRIVSLNDLKNAIGYINVRGPGMDHLTLIRMRVDLKLGREIYCRFKKEVDLSPAITGGKTYECIFDQESHPAISIDE